MGKYRVKVFKHVCKNNYIAKCNEIIDETQLTSNAAGLVDAGFIEPVDETEKEVEVVIETKELIQEEVSKDSDLVLETTDEAKEMKVDDAKEVKSDKKGK